MINYYDCAMFIAKFYDQYGIYFTVEPSTLSMKFFSLLFPISHSLHIKINQSFSRYCALSLYHTHTQHIQSLFLYLYLDFTHTHTHTQHSETYINTNKQDKQTNTHSISYMTSNLWKWK